MDEQHEGSANPHGQSPHGPPLGGRWFPRPPWGYGPTRGNEVTITRVSNGWIVTAPAAIEDDGEDYGEDYLPWPDMDKRVFQFDQKEGMLAFVSTSTPAPDNE